MKHLLLSFLIPLISLTFPKTTISEAAWITVQLDEKASIEFPTQPLTTDVAGHQSWMIDVNDDQKCMALVIDFSKVGLDEEAMMAMVESGEFYDVFRDGFLEEMEGVNLASERKFNVASHPAYELVVSAEDPEAFKYNALYVRNIFIGTKVYALYFYEKENEISEELKNKFFESFKIKKATTKTN